MITKSQFVVWLVALVLAFAGICLISIDARNYFAYGLVIAAVCGGVGMHLAFVPLDHELFAHALKQPDPAKRSELLLRSARRSTQLVRAYRDNGERFYLMRSLLTLSKIRDWQGLDREALEAAEAAAEIALGQDVDTVEVFYWLGVMRSRNLNDPGAVEVLRRVTALPLFELNERDKKFQSAACELLMSKLSEGSDHDEIMQLRRRAELLTAEAF